MPKNTYQSKRFISAKQIVEMADKALYQAKENGRNQYYKVTITASDSPENIAP